MDCQHEGCRCQVSDGEFCSDYCREHVKHDEGVAAHGCGCGHAECTAA